MDAFILSAMPIFEYVCKECEHAFEAIVRGSEKPRCPQCEGRKLEQKLSVFAVGAGKAASAAPATGGCGSCGDPRGPGACALDD
jgi:putative FmdB family regulatory protein